MGSNPDLTPAAQSRRYDQTGQTTSQADNMWSAPAAHQRGSDSSRKTHDDKGEACTAMKWYARRAHRSMQHEHGAHAAADDVGVKKVRISQKVPLKSRLVLRLTLHGR